MHEAAGLSENSVAVALLLDRGADATLRNNYNKLPVDLAEENKHPQGTFTLRDVNPLNG